MARQVTSSENGQKELKSHVLFLGAGASKPLGYPLTGEIMGLLLKRIKSGKLFSEYGGSVSQKERDRIRTLLKRLFPGAFAARNSQPILKSITSVLSLVDYLTVSKQPPSPNISYQDISELQTLLEQAICDVIEPDDYEDLSNSAKNYRANVATWLEWHSTTSSLTVITTNYDIAFESYLFDRRYDKIAENDEELSEAEISCRNHVSIAKEFDFGFAWRLAYNGPVETFVRPGKDSCRYRWYKLHGSFNWLKCDLCGHIYINTDFSIVGLSFMNGRGPNTTCDCGYFPLRPVLVTPSFVRDVRDSNLLEVWRHSLESLRLAKSWTFIGYSFPEEDITVRAMLMRAFHGRRKRLPEITVVSRDVDHELRARVTSILPSATFDSGGAAKFFSAVSKRERK